MYPKTLVVQTKLNPPRLPKRILPRARLQARLLEALDYRLTLVQAGTGYGKSTALAALTREPHLPLAWYHLDYEDSDPSVFLLHLLHSLRRILPTLSDAPLRVFENLDREVTPRWAMFVDALINDLLACLETPSLLVLDDAHHLQHAPALLKLLDRFITHLPAHMHVILATRYPLALPSLLTWRVKGAALEINQSVLTFTTEEIAALFREQYNIILSTSTIDKLATETEGWAIVLQLVGQRLRSGSAPTVESALAQLPRATDNLFAYLAQEILGQQPKDTQSFLRETAVLREMTPAICDCVLRTQDSAVHLAQLVDKGLFVVDLGAQHIRYHHLFREFLYQRLLPIEAQQIHQRAAHCCRAAGAQEEAIFHLLEAHNYADAAASIELLGPNIVRSGRLDTLVGWIHALPTASLENRPRLLSYLGDIARLQSHIDEAQGWYRQAEHRARIHGDQQAVGQALRGQARIYLDTVNPSQAEHLLQEALRISDGQEDREARASLLELLAENRLNAGHPKEAAQLQTHAHELRQEGPGEAELAVRVLLRTGQLDQARQRLEKRASAEQQTPVLHPRAHRETLLLLSLILSFQGEGEAAYRCAVEGKKRGQALNSPFITAVGEMRQGHAWLLRGEAHAYDEACRCYRAAIKLSDSLAVPRLKVEAYWGLCRAHGFQGNLDAAERAAEQGLTIAEAAGDTWIAAMIRVSLGGSYILAQQAAAAAEQLSQARRAFHECGDSYGQALAQLWQCLLWWRSEDHARLTEGLEELRHITQDNGYTYLFTHTTLLSPPDPRNLVPLLLFARETGPNTTFAEHALTTLGLSHVPYHPGYQLRVQTLGAFRVWRGMEEITAQDWRRENARKLFQLLLTYRQTMLDRDQILELLWPDIAPETARRDFKVALSTLYKVLEPNRRRGAPSAYVVREGSLYGLRLNADLTLDVDTFERAIAAGDALIERDPANGLPHYHAALALYQGQYLQAYPYNDWCAKERERLLSRYLRVADQVAGILAKNAQWDAVLAVSQEILARDDCWEAAYRLMMRAYAKLGNRAQVLRTYQRCVERLREILDVEPAPETTAVYQAILDQTV